MSDLLPAFRKLGERVHTAWSRAHFATTAFPDVCLDALAAVAPATQLTLDHVVDYGFACERLPMQFDPNAEFGEPPLTVFMSDRFYICVNFWLESATDIHEHAFSGAFQVLHGGSLHTTFRFDRTEGINDHMEIGALAELDSERLERGDSRPIHGASTIHSLFHLERPSATIVIRTHRDAVSRPQLSYHRAGVGIDPLYDSAEMKRRCQLMRMLQRTAAKQLVDQCLVWFEHTDFVSRFIGTRYCASLLSPEEGDRLLAKVTRADATLGRLVSKVVDEDRRVAGLIRRRTTVTDPALRFFLAVLLNVRGSPRALSLIGQRFPDADPVKSVLKWTRSLGKLPSPSGKGTALGFPMNEAVGAALGSLLRRGNDSALVKDVAAHVKRSLSSREQAQLRDVASALRESEMFRYILQ